MNASLIKLIRNRLSLVVSIVLLFLGAAFAASALMADDKSKIETRKPHIPNCLVNNWPPTDKKDKEQLVEAFEKALHDSAVDDAPGSKLRVELLDTKDNFQAPKDAIKKILDQLHPDNKIKFPKDLVILFYEPEEDSAPTPPATGETNALRCALLHPNHCYLVLFLEPVGSVTAAKSFQDHVMCCYDPYK